MEPRSSVPLRLAAEVAPSPHVPPALPAGAVRAAGTAGNSARRRGREPQHCPRPLRGHGPPAGPSCACAPTPPGARAPPPPPPFKAGSSAPLPPVRPLTRAGSSLTPARGSASAAGLGVPRLRGRPAAIRPAGAEPRPLGGDGPRPPHSAPPLPAAPPPAAAILDRELRDPRQSRPAERRAPRTRHPRGGAPACRAHRWPARLPGGGVYPCDTGVAHAGFCARPRL